MICKEVLDVVALTACLVEEDKAAYFLVVLMRQVCL